MKALGRDPRVSTGWSKMFSWDSRPGAIPAARWPRLDLVVGRLTDQYRRLRQAIAEAADDLLTSPAAGSGGRTVRFSVVHGLHDEACHTGEILLLRKMQGLGRPPRVSS